MKNRGLRSYDRHTSLILLNDFFILQESGRLSQVYENEIVFLRVSIYVQCLFIVLCLYVMCFIC